MKNNTLFIIFLLLLTAGCIKEIKLTTETGDLQQLVVTGDFSNSSGTHAIFLSLPREYGVSAFGHVPGAAITIYDDAGNSAQYTEGFSIDQKQGYYLAPGAMPAVVGRNYWIQIVMPDGQKILSEPQPLLQGIAVDTVIAEARTVNRTTAAGVVIEDTWAFADAVTTLPNTQEEFFMRWEVVCVYLFQEIPIPGPLPPPTKRCYITDNINEQKMVLASYVGQGGTTIRQEMGGRLLDYGFEYKCYFNVAQKRMNRPSFEYFKRISGISNPEGTVFDTPPGSITGNCYFEGNANAARPLGFFEVTAIDTFRLPVNGSVFGEDFNFSPHCTDLDYYQNRDLECFDCLRLPNSTLTRPSYWKD
jgi:hypothetical protein